MTKHATIDFETYSEAGFEWSPALNKWVPPEGDHSKPASL